MNSRDRAHEEDRKALASLERRPWLIVVVALASLIAATALVYSIVTANATQQVRSLTEQNRVLTAKAQAAADSAKQQALANCSLDKLIAEAPLSNPTSAFALNVSVGARVAYKIAQCTGPLLPADPRVTALLPPGVN